MGKRNKKRKTKEKKLTLSQELLLMKKLVSDIKALRDYCTIFSDDCVEKKLDCSTCSITVIETYLIKILSNFRDASERKDTGEIE